ncbi:MAG: DUF5615 family PIN-like protein [Anaerolineae bacterium]
MRFYFDEMVTRKAVDPLIQRGHEVLLATDAGMRQKADSEHLAYATSLGMVMVTFDRPFAGRTMNHTDHAGLVCITGAEQDDIGRIVALLHDFAEKHRPEDAVGLVFWLR